MTKERPIKLRPGRAKPIRQKSLYRTIQVLRTVFGSGRRHYRGAKYQPEPYDQRCSVRLMYNANRKPGQWRAFGRYIAREDAMRESPTVDIPETLDRWQTAGDERVFKLIVSPEFGHQMDLARFTTGFMADMERDLNRPLEWVATAHYDTAHPHVHIALRGVDRHGQAFLIKPQYIKTGLMARAAQNCNDQLGHRTADQISNGQKREVGAYRYTQIDRQIGRYRAPGKQYFTVPPALASRGLVPARLAALKQMGLAKHTLGIAWNVRSDFEVVLRAMQVTGDPLKTVARHGVPLSSEENLRLKGRWTYLYRAVD